MIRLAIVCLQADKCRHTRNANSFLFEKNNYFISWLNSNLFWELLQLMLGRKLNGKIHTCNLFIFQLAYKKFLA